MEILNKIEPNPNSQGNIKEVLNFEDCQAIVHSKQIVTLEEIESYINIDEKKSIEKIEKLTIKEAEEMKRYIKINYCCDDEIANQKIQEWIDGFGIQIYVKAWIRLFLKKLDDLEKCQQNSGFPIEIIYEGMIYNALNEPNRNKEDLNMIENISKNYHNEPFHIFSEILEKF